MKLLNKNCVARAVGVYDTAVGLWPLFSMWSFARSTGLAKPAIVKPLGASWALLGLALLLFSNNRKVIPALGVASTVAGSTLAVTQLWLVSKKVISPIFLVQATAESIIGLMWMLTLTTDRD